MEFCLLPYRIVMSGLGGEEGKRCEGERKERQARGEQGETIGTRKRDAQNTQTASREVVNCDVIRNYF